MFYCNWRHWNVLFWTWQFENLEFSICEKISFSILIWEVIKRACYKNIQIFRQLWFHIEWLERLLSCPKTGRIRGRKLDHHMVPGLLLTRYKYGHVALYSRLLGKAILEAQWRAEPHCWDCQWTWQVALFTYPCNLLRWFGIHFYYRS